MPCAAGAARCCIVNASAVMGCRPIRARGCRPIIVAEGCRPISHWCFDPALVSVSFASRLGTLGYGFLSARRFRAFSEEGCRPVTTANAREVYCHQSAPRMRQTRPSSRL